MILMFAGSNKVSCRFQNTIFWLIYNLAKLGMIPPLQWKMTPFSLGFESWWWLLWRDPTNMWDRQEKNSFSLASIKGVINILNPNNMHYFSINFPQIYPMHLYCFFDFSLSYECHLMIPCNFSGIMISLMDHPHPKSNSTGCHRSPSLVVGKKLGEVAARLKTLTSWKKHPIV